MSKDDIKYKAKVEAEGIQKMRSGSEASKNVKAEVKLNGKGEMETLGLSATEGM